MCAKHAPRHKVSRRFGVDIYGTGGPSLQRRITVPPGGLRAKKGKVSDYALQLIEKQKLKALYGIREKQFRRYFDRAQHSGEPTGRALIQLLEQRLDNVVYRLGFARTRLMARQLVSHGHVLVNGKRVTIPSLLVAQGDRIALTAQALRIPDVQAEMEWRHPTVSWLRRDDGNGEVTALPSRDEVDPEINEALVVEFYSR